MEVQVEQAIEIAWNPLSDQSLKAQAFEFLNQLRTEPTAWQVCINLFCREPKASEVVRHVTLEVVNHAIQSGQMDPEGLGLAKDTLLGYIRQAYGGQNADVDTPNIQNKLTQTITYLFALLYSTRWEDFFDEFLSLTRSGMDPATMSNLPGLYLYLRILSSIHDEIADVLVPRTSQEQKRNNELKDLIRQRDVGKVALSWQEILSRWREAGDDIIDLCLKVVARWVSWIDISLVVNQGLLNPLFELVGRTSDGDAAGSAAKVRNTAIETISEIVAKKMKPPDKIELINFLNLGNLTTQLVASQSICDINAPNYDVDMAEALAKLVNVTALDIVRTVEADGIDEGLKLRAEELLHTFIPWILRFFSDSYDEVCSTVIPSLNDLIALFRKDVKNKGPLSPERTNMLGLILNAIITKMKYDHASSWGREDEQTDEAEFQELRKRLQVLQQGVAAVDEKLYIQVVSHIVNGIFDNFSREGGQVDWRDLDLALHEMYLFGEVAVKNGGLYSKGQPTSAAAEELIVMMMKMIQSNVASFSHPAVQLHYMEICVRYYALFEFHNDLTPQALQHFVQFVHHKHVRVRTRSWYLFQRFVRQLRSQLGNISWTVIEAIGDLLIIKAELPKHESTDDDVSSNDSGQSADAIFSSQLYLFEAVGCISSSQSVKIEDQVLYVQSISNPLYSDLEKHLRQAKDGDEQAMLQVHHIIMALGTLARGFSDGTPGGASSTSVLPATPVVDEFKRTAEAVLVALETLKSSFDVRTAARFAFSRLIPVIGAKILPQLPRWIEGLLCESSSKDEMTTFLRLLDQMIFGFKSEMYSILDVLLTPLLQRVVAALSEPTSGTDDEIQLAELRRQYLNLVLVLFNNELGSVLVSNANQANFESLIATVEHFAKDASDLPTAKMAFGVLSRMSAQWGGPDLINALNPNLPPVQNGARDHVNPSATSTTDAAPLPGFKQFMIERFSALCWALPINPSFDPRDAQARQVLGEIASLQKTIYAKTGEDYLVYLREVCFPDLRMENAAAEEYIRALRTRDVKSFKHFFTQFMQASRG